ncbi:DNA polymerase gamma [Magnaporthiopsis poae ATCC 64411]|uniref:DNA-directed DNA polymerase n=1 Tax=Magnaporthiopsis poae (strain ATCC 64411 / 73-15) TaxID=644358 RepID=A0A0C4E716_MAGP6|nr:DNA polymerase gamma [Magnaporthiopsis poae ATCC 64411]
MLRSFSGRIPSGSVRPFTRLGRHRCDRINGLRLVALRWRASIAQKPQDAAPRPAVSSPTTPAQQPQDSAQSAAPSTTLARQSLARFNEIKVQQLSQHVFEQVFGPDEDLPPQDLVELAKDHLSRHDLLDKNTDTSKPIAFDLPKLQGETLDEHFYKLGVDAAEPYLTQATRFANATTPPLPRQWEHRSGWTRYCDGIEESVEYPPENLLCFDTEVMWKEHPFAVMACAASPTAWYAWISPWLLGESENERQLIPLGDPTQERIVVGHNVGYDRARVMEEYNLEQTRNFFIDTMSLHVAVNGMCSQQRPKWMKAKKDRELREKIAQETTNVELAELLTSGSLSQEEEELWVGRSSINSLRDVAKFHLHVSMDKAIRDDLGELDREGIMGKLDQLLDYCAADVVVTHRVYQIVFPSFLKRCPHPVSFAALRHLSSVILPVNESWAAYIAKAEDVYRKLSDGVVARLVALTEKALEIKDDPEKWGSDPWLSQLDWSGQDIKMVKGKKKGDPPRPALRQKKPGMPKWYKDLFAKVDGPIGITVRTRIAPLLLRLSWDGHPLVWSDKYAWTFRVPREEQYDYVKKQMVKCDMSDETIEKLRTDADHVYFKLPHKDGPTARCGSPMAKSYLPYFESGVLTSEYPYAKEALEMNASCSYWISSRDRITSQLVVYEDDVPPSPGGPLRPEETGSLQTEKAGSPNAEDANPPQAEEADLQPAEEGISAAPAELGDDPMLPPTESLTVAESITISGRPESANSLQTEEGDSLQTKGAEAVRLMPRQGFILPQVIPMGTVTRRAVENTWLTASNAKKNRVGSELKAMVKAPPGYSFVGADVDSEELWIASVLGDAVFKMHGGNAIGFMTLEGSKAAGTDLHSRTASILGITRSQSKVFNYGRIYGAGLKFASQLLRQFNPLLSERESTETASKLYAATKGAKTNRKSLYGNQFWRGGTESFVFNKLEEFAQQERPRTPVLGAGITEALMAQYVPKGAYLTSRINWAIQSSGVDYLHLLIVSMDYLIRRFNIDARLAITVHDEIRYLVKDHDKYRTAMALQVANLWTRAMFAEQVGIRDLPQSAAFFSAVDIDRVLRKEVDMDCVTPSHAEPIPHGESLDIATLLEKGAEAYLDPATAPRPGLEPKLDGIEYTPRKTVMQQLAEDDPATSDISFIKAQISADDAELSRILAEKRQPKITASSSPSAPSDVEKVKKTAGSGVTRKTKSVLPYHAQAQLPFIDEIISISDASSFVRQSGGPAASKSTRGWEQHLGGSKAPPTRQSPTRW